MNLNGFGVKLLLTRQTRSAEVKLDNIPVFSPIVSEQNKGTGMEDHVFAKKSFLIK